jgi:hypothetical protein
MGYYARRPEIDPETSLTEQEIGEIPDPQERYDLVLAHYLAACISLEWAAELLGLAWLDLHARCQRLEVPLDISSGNPSERNT